MGTAMDESAPPKARHTSSVVRGSELRSEQRQTRARVTAAIEALRDGKTVIVIGDRHSGFVAALVASADQTTAETVNFFITRGRGPLYVNADSGRLNVLGLELIRPHTATLDRAAIHVPADYRKGTTTGLSAADRAATVRAIADPSSQAKDFRVPGHVYLIGARRWGVLERPGHTEASVDLVRMAGREPVAMSCAMLSEDGATAGVDEVHEFAALHGLNVIRIADVSGYRRESEEVIERIGEAFLPIPQGRFVAVGYSDRFEQGEHLALVMGELREPEPIMTRVHAECLAGDAFASTACSCKADLRNSIDEIAEHGRGVLLYIRAPGGDRDRLRHMEPALAPALGDVDQQAVDTAVNGIALSMLKDLGITADRLRVEPPHEAVR
jgi:3,4-dihydroxy 2-butanone 4-phosphate synthase/GTP cyclohydrolase II